MQLLLKMTSEVVQRAKVLPTKPDTQAQSLNSHSEERQQIPTG